jgi:hypothetical protein
MKRKNCHTTCYIGLEFCDEVDEHSTTAAGTTAERRYNTKEAERVEGGLMKSCF